MHVFCYNILDLVYKHLLIVLCNKGNGIARMFLAEFRDKILFFLSTVWMISNLNPFEWDLRSGVHLKHPAS